MKDKLKFLSVLLLFFAARTYSDTVITSDLKTWGVSETESSYILNSNVTISEQITIRGTVTLKLNEGFTLTVTKGIGVQSDAILIIEGKGTLNASNSDGAGIGGTKSENAASGTIIINDGNITATGGTYSAGIGGGGGNSNSNWANKIIINGGNITAKGGSNGAGIGGGKYSNLTTFEMNGGKVTAIGGSGSAGIGGGDGSGWGGEYGGAGTLIINGGELHATSSGEASGIGGGSRGGCSAIYINGGKIYAKSASGYAIGASAHGQEGTISINWTSQDDYLNMSESSKGFRYNNLIVGKDFRYADTGSDGMTATIVTNEAISGKVWIIPLVYHTVTFLNGNYYIGESDSTKTFYGSKLENPGSLSKTGYTFQGWYKTRNFSDSPWDFSTDLVEDDMTLYAKFIADEIKVSTQNFFEWTGNELSINPSVTSNDGSLSLKKDSDYTISYQKGSESVTSISDTGFYTITATGKGDYAGKSCGSQFVVLKGNGSESAPFLISSEGEWDCLKKSLEAGYSYTRKNISLESDIEISSSIGTSESPFNATFDGNGHVIYKESGSIFEYIKTAKIKNLRTNLTEESLAANSAGTNRITDLKQVYSSVQSGLNKIFTLGSHTLYGSDMEIENLLSTYPLTQSPVEINPTITVCGENLTSGTDYTISFTKNEESSSQPVSEISDYGNYTAIFTGKGNYTGTYSHNFIVPQNKEGEISTDEAGTYFINMPSDSSVLNFDATGFSKGFTFKIYDDGGQGGGFFSGISGNFTSGAEGYLKITVAEGYLIQFSGIVGTRTKYDYLSIYDGSSISEQSLYYHIHGENNENEYKVHLSTTNTSSNSALIHFKGSNSTCEGLEVTATIVNTKSLTAKEDKYKKGVYYTSFYTEEENFLADNDTQVFYATKDADGKILLEETEKRVILTGQGVILKSKKENITLYATGQTDTYESILSGTNAAIESAKDSMSGRVYIIGNSKKGGVGFYRWEGKIDENKAFLKTDN